MPKMPKIYSNSWFRASRRTSRLFGHKKFIPRKNWQNSQWGSNKLYWKSWRTRSRNSQKISRRRRQGICRKLVQKNPSGKVPKQGLSPWRNQSCKGCSWPWKRVEKKWAEWVHWKSQSGWTAEYSKRLKWKLSY